MDEALPSYQRRHLHVGGPAVIDLIDRDHATTMRNPLFVARADGSTRSRAATSTQTNCAVPWRASSQSRTLCRTREENTLRPSPEDYIAITDLLARYCLMLDLGDVERWLALFTPDGSFEVYGRIFSGHDGLRKMVEAAPGGLHLGGQPVIDLPDRDHATTTQNLLFDARADGSSRSAIYSDELRRTEAGWRIAKRRCRFITADGLADRPAR